MIIVVLLVLFGLAIFAAAASSAKVACFLALGVIIFCLWWQAVEGNWEWFTFQFASVLLLLFLTIAPGIVIGICISLFRHRRETG